MRLKNIPLPSAIPEAISLQKELSEHLILEGNLKDVELVAGVDCSSYYNTGVMVGAVVVWSLSKLEPVAEVTALKEVDFPYVPGLLAFRELPALLKAFEKLEVIPEVVICDGQGTAHMRGFGIACHLGLYLEIPTLGCGKSRLVGSYEMPAENKGSVTLLTYKGEEIGCVVRTRKGVKPVFVSPGHLICMDGAVEMVFKTCSKYRLPEPIRAAHKLAGETMRMINEGNPK